MNKILTDVDGVLLNWIDPFLKWAENFKVRNPNAIHTDFYAVENLFYDMNRGEVYNLVEEFNCSDNFSKLEAIKGADLILPLLAKEYEIIAITSCNKEAIPSREKNISKVFGNYIKDIFYVPLRSSKREELKKFDPSYWVEDTVPYATSGAECGHKTFLMDHTYNQENGPFTRVKDWSDIIKVI
jgi:5'(3')-deoxyribonucleotidase